MKSDFLSVDKKDMIRGVLMAMFAAAASVLSPVLMAGALPTVAILQQAGIVGIGTGTAYIVKNYFTNSKDEFFKSE